MNNLLNKYIYLETTPLFNNVTIILQLIILLKHSVTYTEHRVFFFLIKELTTLCYPKVPCCVRKIYVLSGEQQYNVNVSLEYR